MIIRKGLSRICILYGKYAIKIPNFLRGIESFCWGIINNQEENTWKGPHTMKIYYSSWLFNICERCDPYIHKEYSGKAYKEWIKKRNNYLCRPEKKSSSFGYNQKGDIVAIDYAPTYICKICKNNANLREKTEGIQQKRKKKEL